MDTNTLYVLDFSTSQVHIYEIEAGQQIEDVEQFIQDQGHKLSESQFMYGDIEVTNHIPEQRGGAFMIAYGSMRVRLMANDKQSALYQAQQDYNKPPAKRLLDWKDSEHTAEEWEIIKM